MFMGMCVRGRVRFSLLSHFLFVLITTMLLIAWTGNSVSIITLFWARYFQTAGSSETRVESVSVSLSASSTHASCESARFHSACSPCLSCRLRHK
ncbi:hypothetical protein DFH11DRAFT_1629399 [Phellopilus nigrolimitatus]|nr:hypothetical protein DFH11DRAFT_1629399 [Phellopilus nigrolimitatus]